MRIALKFGYYGQYYQGYARQPKQRTIEDEIIRILNKLGYINNISESVFRSASRTDKGVSAISNVIAFNTKASISNMIENLNKNSSNIIFYGRKRVNTDFNPRYAKQRWYRYYLKNENFDIKKILHTIAIFTGIHDYTNFARIEKNKNPIREINNIILNIEDKYISIDFFAQTFLWNQIRRIISAILYEQTGKIERKDIKKALVNPKIKIDYGLASAKTLILKDIFYDFRFNYDNNKLKNIEDIEKDIKTRCLSS